MVTMEEVYSTSGIKQGWKFKHQSSAREVELFNGLKDVLVATEMGEHIAASLSLKKTFELLGQPLNFSWDTHALQEILRSCVYFSVSSTASINGLILLDLFRNESLLQSQAEFLNDFGSLAVNVHEPKIAQEVFTRLLETNENVDGLNKAIILNNLGCSLGLQGQYSKAEECLKKSEVLFEQIVGQDEKAQELTKLCLASIFNNRGWSLAKLGEHNKAHTYFKKVFARATDDKILENYILFPVHRNTISLLLAQNSVNSAKEMLQQHLLQCRDLGDKTLISYMEMELLSLQLNFAHSSKHAEETVVSLTKDFESQKPFDGLITGNATVLVLSKLVYLNRQIGRLRKALELATEVVDLCKRVYGAHHSLTASVLHLCACVSWDYGDIPNSVKALRESSEILRDIYKDGHPQLASCYFKLSFFHCKQNDLSGAQKFFVDALKVVANVFGSRASVIPVDKLLGTKNIVESLLFRFASVFEKHERTFSPGEGSAKLEDFEGRSFEEGEEDTGKNCLVEEESVKNGRTESQNSKSADLVAAATKNWHPLNEKLMQGLPRMLSVGTVLNVLQFCRSQDDLQSVVFDQGRFANFYTASLVQIIQVVVEFGKRASSGRSSGVHVDVLSEMLMKLKTSAIPSLFSNETSLSPEDGTDDAEKQCFVMAALSLLGYAFTEANEQQKACEAYNSLGDCLALLQQESGQCDAFNVLSQEHKFYYSAKVVSSLEQELTVCTVLTTIPGSSQSNNQVRDLADGSRVGKLSIHDDSSGCRVIVTGQIHGRVDIDDLRRISQKCEESLGQAWEAAPRHECRGTCLIQLDKPICYGNTPLLLSELELLPFCLNVFLVRGGLSDEFVFRYCQSLWKLSLPAHTPQQLMDKLLVTFIREEGKLASFSDVSHKNRKIVLACDTPAPLRIILANIGESVEVTSQVVLDTVLPECHCTNIQDFINDVIRSCASRGAVKVLQFKEYCAVSGGLCEPHMPEAVSLSRLDEVTRDGANGEETQLKEVRCLFRQCLKHWRLEAASLQSMVRSQSTVHVSAPVGQVTHNTVHDFFPQESCAAVPAGNAVHNSLFLATPTISSAVERSLSPEPPSAAAVEQNFASLVERVEKLASERDALKRENKELFKELGEALFERDFMLKALLGNRCLTELKLGEREEQGNLECRELSEHMSAGACVKALVSQDEPSVPVGGSAKQTGPDSNSNMEVNSAAASCGASTTGIQHKTDVSYHWRKSDSKDYNDNTLVKGEDAGSPFIPKKSNFIGEVHVVASRKNVSSAPNATDMAPDAKLNFYSKDVSTQGKGGAKPPNEEHTAHEKASQGSRGHEHYDKGVKAGDEHGSGTYYSIESVTGSLDSTLSLERTCSSYGPGTVRTGSHWSSATPPVEQAFSKSLHTPSDDQVVEKSDHMSSDTPPDDQAFNGSAHRRSDTLSDDPVIKKSAHRFSNNPPDDEAFSKSDHMSSGTPPEDQVFNRSARRRSDTPPDDEVIKTIAHRFSNTPPDDGAFSRSEHRSSDTPPEDQAFNRSAHRRSDTQSDDQVIKKSAHRSSNTPPDDEAFNRSDHMSSDTPPDDQAFNRSAHRRSDTPLDDQVIKKNTHRFSNTPPDDKAFSRSEHGFSDAPSEDQAFNRSAHRRLDIASDDQVIRKNTHRFSNTPPDDKAFSRSEHGFSDAPSEDQAFNRSAHRRSDTQSDDQVIKKSAHRSSNTPPDDEAFNRSDHMSSDTPPDDQAFNRSAHRRSDTPLDDQVIKKNTHRFSNTPPDGKAFSRSEHGFSDAPSEDQAFNRSAHRRSDNQSDDQVIKKSAHRSTNTPPDDEAFNSIEHMSSDTPPDDQAFNRSAHRRSDTPSDDQVIKKSAHRSSNTPPDDEAFNRSDHMSSDTPPDDQAFNRSAHRRSDTASGDPVINESAHRFSNTPLDDEAFTRSDHISSDTPPEDQAFNRSAHRRLDTASDDQVINESAHRFSNTPPDDKAFSRSEHGFSDAPSEDQAFNRSAHRRSDTQSDDQVIKKNTHRSSNTTLDDEAFNRSEERSSDTPLDDQAFNRSAHRRLDTAPDDQVIKKSAHRFSNTPDDEAFSESDHMSSDTPPDDQAFNRSAHRRLDTASDDQVINESAHRFSNTPPDDKAFSRSEHEFSDTLPEDQVFNRSARRRSDTQSDDQVIKKNTHRFSNTLPDEKAFTRSEQRSSDTPLDDQAFNRSAHRRLDTASDDQVINESAHRFSNTALDGEAFNRSEHRSLDTPGDDQTFYNNGHSSLNTPLGEQVFKVSAQRSSDTPSDNQAIKKTDHTSVTLQDDQAMSKIGNRVPYHIQGARPKTATSRHISASVDVIDGGAPPGFGGLSAAFLARHSADTSLPYLGSPENGLSHSANRFLSYRGVTDPHSSSHDIDEVGLNGRIDVISSGAGQVYPVTAPGALFEQRPASHPSEGYRSSSAHWQPTDPSSLSEKLSLTSVQNRCFTERDELDSPVAEIPLCAAGSNHRLLHLSASTAANQPSSRHLRTESCWVDSEREAAGLLMRESIVEEDNFGPWASSASWIPNINDMQGGADNGSLSSDSAVSCGDRSTHSLEMKVAQASSLVDRLVRESNERELASRRLGQLREQRTLREARQRQERERQFRAQREREQRQEEQARKNKSLQSAKQLEIPSKAPIQESPRWLCEHYKRRCKVSFPCCGVFYACHRCHNGSGKCSVEDVKALQATRLQCVVCKNEQEITEDSQTCNSCGTKLSQYFCPLCKHFTSVEKKPYHCEKCGICRIHKDKSFHCSVCNVCLDRRLKGKHKCRPNSGHDECCICLEDAFSGCHILPCSHKVHRGCAVAMMQNGVRTCPVCRHPLNTMFPNSDE